MATLTVTATHSYTGEILDNIDAITFETTGFANAIFASSQFGGSGISNSVHITGDANLFRVRQGAVLRLLCSAKARPSSRHRRRVDGSDHCRPCREPDRQHRRPRGDTARRRDG
jgi:hypothetical protein